MSAARREHAGRAFDSVAGEYDRVRPGYPASLIDAALEFGALRAGARVLEVGCGTGQLTLALLERGLRIDAVDPGPELVALARRRIGDASAVRFHVGRFEDVALPESEFDAVFSASAFHWVDPTVGWSKAARVLRANGVLALLNHISVSDDSGETQAELLALYRQVIPEAAEWRLRDTGTVLEGAEARHGDVSELWSWITTHALSAPEAAGLFGDVRVETVSRQSEESATQVLDMLRTTSTYLRLDPDRRRTLEDGIADVVERLGGVYRSRYLAVLALARAR